MFLEILELNVEVWAIMC